MNFQQAIQFVQITETNKFAPELNKLWMINDIYYRVNGVTTIDEAIRLIFNQTLKATKL